MNDILISFILYFVIIFILKIILATANFANFAKFTVAYRNPTNLTLPTRP